MPHPVGDRAFVEVEEDPRRDHAEHVLDVEAPRERCLDRDPSGPESAALRAHLEIGRSHLGCVVEPERDEGCARRIGELEREPPTEFVADVDRRRRRLGAREEAAFCLVVVLHRAVQVEMVLRHVREDEHIEANTIEAAQNRPMGRRLDRDALVSGIEHLAEEALQVDRLGRRVRRGPCRPTDDPLDRADEPR